MAAMRRRRGDDRGVTMVEAAFILPVVLLVFFSIIEFGLYFAAVSTTSSSTRAGARFGSANFAVSSDRDAAVEQMRAEVERALRARTSLEQPQALWVYKASPSGAPIGGSGFTSCLTDCYRFTWDPISGTFSSRQGGWTSIDPCGTTIDNIGVFLEVEHTLVPGLFDSNRTIKEYTVVRIEPVPAEQCPPGST